MTPTNCKHILKSDLGKPTFLSRSYRPGASKMQAIITPTSIIIAYAIRVDVEFLHDGQALQQSEHAAVPTQQAREPTTHPILKFNTPK